MRIIEPDPQRAKLTAAQLPSVRVYQATGFDPEFLDRERIGQSRAAVFVMQDDAKNHYAATLAKLHGVSFTIAIVHQAASTRCSSARGSTWRSTRGRSQRRKSSASPTIREPVR